MNRLLKKTIQNVLNKLGYSLKRIDHPFDFKALLYLYLRKNSNLFFIQIGACDGISFDPIYRFMTRNYPRTRGIVIEPLRDYFKQLQLNYRRYPHIISLNVGIHNTETDMILYRVAPVTMKDLPSFNKGISSFNKNHHKLFGTPSNVIIPERVPCISFGQLLKNHQIRKIDLLQIDTEGYDAEIILNIDFAFIKPSIIRFEHGLPDRIMSKETFTKLIELLHENNYELAFENYDATAYQRNIFLDY